MTNNKKIEHKATDNTIYDSSDNERIGYRIGMSDKEFNDYLNYKLTEGMSKKNRLLILKYEKEID